MVEIVVAGGVLVALEVSDSGAELGRDSGKRVQLTPRND